MPDTSWTLVADLDRCEGHGLCVDEAPGHLRLVDDELVLVEAAVSDADLTAVRAAARVCPVAALRLRREP